MKLSTRSLGILRACMLALSSVVAHAAWSAALGQTALPTSGNDGPVTVYYPSNAPEQAVRRGRMTLRLGWSLRPGEVSRSIDAIGRDARFAPLLQLDKVGVYGMSAGGHTALTLAGGRWSPAGFARHCSAHIGEDFPACVGLITQPTGGPLDAFKQWLAVRVIQARFDDDRMREHLDPRVAAVVAAVPAAADYDLSSLTVPRVPLALVLAEKDRWLAPRFHGAAVRSACRNCEVIADMPDGGHGSMLSPLPPDIGGIAGELLNDPPGFDRSRMPEVDRKIAAFFVRYVPAIDAPVANAVPAEATN